MKVNFNEIWLKQVLDKIEADFTISPSIICTTFGYRNAWPC